MMEKREKEMFCAAGTHHDANEVMRFLLVKCLGYLCIILFSIESLCFSPPPSPLSVPSDLPFIEACRHGEKMKALSFIKQGQKVNVVDRNGLVPLQIAAYMGHMDIIHILLEHGADVNFHSSYYPAVYVAKTEEITLLLIERGADIRVPYPSQDGYPVSNALFHKAAGKGWDTLLCAMFEKVKDADALDFNKQTALFAAARNGRLSCLMMLLEWGAKVDHVDKYGITPFMVACAQGQIETAKALLKAGADPKHKMKTGESVLGFTVQRCWSPSMAGYDGIERSFIPVVRLQIRSGAIIEKSILDSLQKAPFLNYSCQEVLGLLQAEYEASKHAHSPY
jgi:ankyrin repeat protein